MQQSSQVKSAPVYPSPTRGWIVTGLLTAAYLLSYIDRQVIFLLIDPIKADLGATDFQMSLLVGLAFSLFYSVAGLPLGRLADRTNRVYLASAGIAIWSVMTIACGLSKNYFQLFLARMGVGAGEASIGPSAVSIIGDYFPPEKSARPTAVLSAAGMLGGALAFIVGGAILSWTTTNGVPSLPVLGQTAPWQFTFIVCGLPGLTLAPIILWFVKEPLRRNVATASDGESNHILPFLKRRWRTYVGFFVGFGCVISIGYAISSWLPTVYTRFYGWPAAQIGAVIGIFALLSGFVGPFLASFVNGILVKRGRDDAYLFAGVLFTLGLGGAVLVGQAIPGAWPSLLISCFGVFFMAATVATAYMTVQALAPNQFRAQLTAIFILSTNLIGSTIGPVLVATFTDFVFRDEMMIKWSLMATAAVMAPLALMLFYWSRESFIGSVRDAKVWRNDAGIDRDPESD